MKFLKMDGGIFGRCRGIDKSLIGGFKTKVFTGSEVVLRAVA
jgi:hypothetical protein